MSLGNMTKTARQKYLIQQAIWYFDTPVTWLNLKLYTIQNNKLFKKKILPNFDE